MSHKHHSHEHSPATQEARSLSEIARMRFKALTTAARGHIEEAQASMQQALAQSRRAIDDSLSAMDALDEAASDGPPSEEPYPVVTPAESVSAAVTAMEIANTRAQAAMSEAMLAMQRAVFAQTHPHAQAGAPGEESGAVSPMAGT